jgi:hypothetical protein
MDVNVCLPLRMPGSVSRPRKASNEGILDTGEHQQGSRKAPTRIPVPYSTLGVRLTVRARRVR